VRRLWNLSVIQLPNNIDSKDLEISVAPKSIKLWDFDVLKGVLKSAPEPLRLYLLLMANCGMTQKDVSDLLPRQVDWKNGIISRKRSKTKKWENVPLVSYKLWPTTFELLKKHGSRDGVRVLSAPDGSPLVVDDLSKNNKGSKQDKISKIWGDWISKAKVKDARPIHDIRKTSSSRLGAHETYGRFAQFFLAQSAKTVADKHYVVPSQEQFDKAVAWLGKQYGL
jgi:integrase